MISSAVWLAQCLVKFHSRGVVPPESIIIAQYSDVKLSDLHKTLLIPQASTQLRPNDVTFVGKAPSTSSTRVSDVNRLR